MLLENVGKLILVIKWQRIWLKYVCSCVLWKVEVKSDKLRYIAKEIPEQNVKFMVCYVITA